jgi:hypothetical protein
LVKSLLNDSDHSTAIVQDYLTPTNESEIIQHFSDVDVIVDMSASIPVARKLSDDNQFSSRRISLFLTPSGRDLVMLSEPQDRSVHLTSIEAQYYRSIIRNSLKNHLTVDSEQVRYSASCGDVSSRIRQDDVAIFSGIGAKALMKAIPDVKGSISIWSGSEFGEVRLNVTEVYDTHNFNSGKWEVILDDFLVSKIHQAREARLPNETGGILLALHDHFAKRIYVVDTILSPKDSKEYPHAYYRGIAGLEQELWSIAVMTGNRLTYAGEWHSHPDGCSVSQSVDDKKLYEWIEEHMQQVGLPALMIIVGDNDKIGVYSE